MGLTETVSLPMVCEMDLMDDTIRAMSYAIGALASKHGDQYRDQYRDYERRIVDILDGALVERPNTISGLQAKRRSPLVGLHPTFTKEGRRF